MSVTLIQVELWRSKSDCSARGDSRGYLARTAPRDTNPTPCKGVSDLLIRDPQLRIVLNVSPDYLEWRRLDCADATVVERAQIRDLTLQVLRQAFANAPIAVERFGHGDDMHENAFIKRRRPVQAGWLNFDRA
jgi:hypothetical protein